MTPTAIKRRLQNSPDFIHSRRFRNSMARLEKRYPDEAPDHVSAMVLDLTVEEFAAEYDRIVAKMRGLMGADT